MHTLVTGGAGFIGSHLVERLLGRGERVTVLDDLSTGRRANLREVADSERFELHVGSVLDRPLVEELVEGADRVLHLAATVGVRLVLGWPARTIETNAKGSGIVLEAAARRGIPLLLASSSEVYGRRARLPMHEDDPIVSEPPTEARLSYAFSKARAEETAGELAREEGLRVVVVRLFNTVGPRQRGRYGMVLPRFVRQAVAGEPITVYGDGRQTRSFAHVSDTVEACLRLIENPAAHGRVFNVGSDREVSIARLALLVRRAVRSDSRIVNVPRREAYGTAFRDFPRRRPDLRRLEEVCGFRPRIPLEEILREVADECRVRRSAEELSVPLPRPA